jgi:uncharacterized protein YqeY
VSAVMKSLSDEDRKDFGKVMRVAAPMFRGKADGGKVAEIVKELL